MEIFNMKKGIKLAGVEHLLEVIETHEKYKKAYFWTPGRSSSDRRWRESQFPGLDCIMNLDVGTLEIQMDYRETCGNCYYSNDFKLNNQSITIRDIKKIAGFFGHKKSCIVSDGEGIAFKVAGATLEKYDRSDLTETQLKLIKIYELMTSNGEKEGKSKRVAALKSYLWNIVTNKKSTKKQRADIKKHFELEV